jgi:hypothetical protein
LTGQIPEWLGNLKELVELDLSANEFEGTCRIRATGRPQISLIQFFLTGEIPASLGNCIQLTKLWLDNNQLTGECIIRVHFSFEFLLLVFFFDRRDPSFTWKLHRTEIS